MGRIGPVPVEAGANVRDSRQVLVIADEIRTSSSATERSYPCGGWLGPRNCWSTHSDLDVVEPRLRAHGACGESKHPHVALEPGGLRRDRQAHSGLLVGRVPNLVVAYQAGKGSVEVCHERGCQLRPTLQVARPGMIRGHACRARVGARFE